MGETSLRNAAIGAVVPVFLFFLPFAAVIGGGIAGYLEAADGRTEYADGLKVGVLSGVIALVPFVLLLFAVGALVPFVPVEIAGLGILFAFVAFLAAAVYLLGAGALGGLVGVVIQGEL